MALMDCGFNVPPDETHIWKYMDIESFLSLVSTSSLILAKLTLFKDLLDGELWTEHEEYIRNAVAQSRAQEMTDELIKKFREMRTRTYASCWHVSVNQSAALWDLYSKQSGIAIVSTVGQLKNAAQEAAEDLGMGMVHYGESLPPSLAYNPAISMFAPAFWKRPSFEHEKELRLICCRLSSKQSEAIPDVIKLQVELPKLVSQIYISPVAPHWLVEAMKEVLRRFSCATIPVKQSELYGKDLH